MKCRNLLYKLSALVCSDLQLVSPQDAGGGGRNSERCGNAAANEPSETDEIRNAWTNNQMPKLKRGKIKENPRTVNTAGFPHLQIITSNLIDWQ